MLGLEESHVEGWVNKLKKSEHFPESYGFLKLKSDFLGHFLPLLPIHVNAFNRERSTPAYSSLLAISEWEIFKNIFLKCGQYICKVCDNG